MPKRKDKTQSPEERLQEMLVPESEQPYPVPENWCWTYWGVVGDFFAGSGFKEECQGKQDLPIPFYKVGSLKSSDIQGYLQDISNTVDDEIRELLHATLIPKNSLIFAKIGEAIRLNRRALNSAPCCIDNNLMAFISKKCNFVYVYFWSQNIDLYKFTNATTVPAIRKSDLESISFPLPPLPEQQRIVDRIESLFSKLDAAKTKAQAVVDSHESRKAAILHKAFTGELTKKWREENNISFEDWSFQPLKDCGTWSGGGTPSISHPEYWDDGDIPWVTSKDMKSDVIAQTQICTNQLGIENPSAIYSEKPAVLFVTRSGILRRTLPIAVIERPFTVNQDLKVLTPTDISVRYLFWACKSAEKKILSTCMKSGTTVESINFDRLKEFSIPVAPKEEQKAIVKTLEQLIRRENQATDAAGKIILQIDAMKKYILNRAFRGELGTNDPREESAVGLLMQDIEEK